MLRLLPPPSPQTSIIDQLKYSQTNRRPFIVRINHTPVATKAKKPVKAAKKK
jgi:hypothetical protein